MITRLKRNGNYIYILFSVYFLILFVSLLWPFKIRFNNTSWLKDSNGIAFFAPGQVISSAPFVELINSLHEGTGLTLEIWLSTDNFTQDGPARIVSYSQNTLLRNFTLGQDGQKLVLRMRTSDTDLNALSTQHEIDNIFTSPRPVHLVLTYDFSVLKIYLDGQIIATEYKSSDRFTSWDDSYYFVLGNEATGDRPWIGKIYYLAVYNNALDKQAIERHYKIVWQSDYDSSIVSFKFGSEVIPVVDYQFAHGQGNTVWEIKKEHPSFNLKIPFVIRNIERQYLSTSINPKSPDQLVDIFLNVLCFIPFGIFLHFMLRKRYGNSRWILFLIFGSGFGFSVLIESFQYMMHERFSSLIDVFCNITGIFIGIQVNKYFRLRWSKNFN